MTQPSLGLFATLYTTCSLHRFKPDPIPDEVLFQLFDAAIQAPSGQNAQDWRFVLIVMPALRQAQDRLRRVSRGGVLAGASQGIGPLASVG